MTRTVLFLATFLVVVSAIRWTESRPVELVVEVSAGGAELHRFDSFRVDPARIPMAHQSPILVGYLGDIPMVCLDLRPPGPPLHPARTERGWGQAVARHGIVYTPPQGYFLPDANCRVDVRVRAIRAGGGS